MPFSLTKAPKNAIILKVKNPVPKKEAVILKKINKTRVWMILTVVLVFLFTFGVAAEDSSYLSHNMELCKTEKQSSAGLL